MRTVVATLFFCAIGCGGTTEPASIDDPRIEQMREDFASIGQNVSDSDIREIIRIKERKHGTATHDERGYPIWGFRPWEKPKQPWSWNELIRPFIVRPDRTQQSHIKTAVDVEHRYVEILYPNTSDPALVEAAAVEVWHHFAREVNERHPQAGYKRVKVNIYVDGQDDRMPAGIVYNYASRKLPDQPVTEWFTFEKSALIFKPTK